MGYRDQSEALRGRIAYLEKELKVARGEATSDEVEPQTAQLTSSSPLMKKVARHSLSVDGQVTKVGLDSIRQLLWAKLGAAESLHEGEGLQGGRPPGGCVLTYARGALVLRIFELSGKTHFSLDHSRRTFGQASVALISLAAVMTLSMLAAGVHDDWTQMTMGIFGIVVVLLGPLMLIRSWTRESEIFDLLKEVARVGTEHISMERIAARVATGEAPSAVELDAEIREPVETSLEQER